MSDIPIADELRQLAAEARRKSKEEAQAMGEEAKRKAETCRECWIELCKRDGLDLIVDLLRDEAKKEAHQCKFVATRNELESLPMLDDECAVTQLFQSRKETKPELIACHAMHLVPAVRDQLEEQGITVRSEPFGPERIMWVLDWGEPMSTC